MLPEETRQICMIWPVFHGLDLYYANQAQPLTMAGEALDDLCRSLCIWSVRGVHHCTFPAHLPSTVPLLLFRNGVGTGGVGTAFLFPDAQDGRHISDIFIDESSTLH